MEWNIYNDIGKKKFEIKYGSGKAKEYISLFVQELIEVALVDLSL